MQIKPERPARLNEVQWVRSWFAEHYQAGDVFAHCDTEAMTLQAAVQFARAVAAAERERCAQLCDDEFPRLQSSVERDLCVWLAQRIRKA